MVAGCPRRPKLTSYHGALYIKYHGSRVSRSSVPVAVERRSSTWAVDLEIEGFEMCDGAWQRLSVVARSIQYSRERILQERGKYIVANVFLLFHLLLRALWPFRELR